MGIKEISVSTEKSADEESFAQVRSILLTFPSSDMMVGEDLG